MNDETKNQAEQEITMDDLSRWLEFGCWVAIALFPVLYYVNGRSVSTDQAVVRSALVLLASLGAIVLRWRNWRSERLSRSQKGPSEVASGDRSA